MSEQAHDWRECMVTTDTSEGGNCLSEADYETDEERDEREFQEERIRQKVRSAMGLGYFRGAVINNLRSEIPGHPTLVARNRGIAPAALRGKLRAL